DFPEITESQPELFAQHYTEAGFPDKAVAYWGKAAQRSAARFFAMAEAAAQFQKGLDQLALLPDSPDRQRHELEFCCGLAAVLQIVKGDRASETGRAYGKHWSCGSAWVLPLSSFTFPGESRDTTYTAANSIWRCSWPTVRCIEAANATIQLASFSAIIPPVTTCCLRAGLYRAARIWKKCLRCTIRSPTAR